MVLFQLVEDLDLTKSKSRNPKVSDGQFRRSRHLSVILHEYISSMVTAGEVDKEVAEQNVEITKVRYQFFHYTSGIGHGLIAVILL